ncbi:lectin BRA-3-like [Glandiceps talaboti]
MGLNDKLDISKAARETGDLSSAHKLSLTTLSRCRRRQLLPCVGSWPLSNVTVNVGFNSVSGYSQSICPSTWPTYGGNCYSFIDAENDWIKAESACKSFGGHLASIHSRQENEFVVGLLPSSQKVWIGLNDKDWEGEFAWSDGSDVEYTNWANNAPDDKRGEDCTAYNPSLTTSSQWDDMDCNKEYKFVCKITIDV